MNRTALLVDARDVKPGDMLGSHGAEVGIVKTVEVLADHVNLSGRGFGSTIPLGEQVWILRRTR